MSPAFALVFYISKIAYYIPTVCILAILQFPMHTLNFIFNVQMALYLVHHNVYNQCMGIRIIMRSTKTASIPSNYEYLLDFVLFCVWTIPTDLVKNLPFKKV
jgi:hypothetical protein